MLPTFADPLGIIPKRNPVPEDSPINARPNIVWICADDYAANVCGAYGDRQVRTPHLDHLAAEGMRFGRAFSNCPLSTPARQAFWTGRYPHAIGVTLSPTPLPDYEVTLPALLRSAGYEVAAFGKTHYYAARKHEFDVCADHEEYQEWRCWHCPRTLPPGLKTLGPWRPFFDPAAIWLNSEVLPYPAFDADMADTYYSTRACEYLRASKSKPFFLYVSLFANHSPFRFPLEFRGRHDPDLFRVPEIGAEDVEQIPTVFRDLTDAQKQGILAAYYTATEFLDHNVGRVLAALEQAPFAANTLTLFTSDHGYLLGQHGRFEKHCCYDRAIRAALLVRYPGVVAPGQTTDALVELLDLPPTILDLCALKAPGNMHGRSLAALLRGQQMSHRAQVIVEYADNEEAAIRTACWKLIYSTGLRQRRDGYHLPGRRSRRSLRLYDLVNDPDEQINRASDAACKKVVSELLQQLATHFETTARQMEPTTRTGDVFAILDEMLPPPDAWR